MARLALIPGLPSLVVLLALASPAAAGTEEPGAAAEPSEARRILDHVDDLFRGESSHGRATMTIRTEHWERGLTLEFWSEGEERSLIRILAPTKEKGTATLKSGNEIWNYLPKVKRVIKLPSSMMSSSWMGSHFTNDDLVKESRMADDYEYEVSFRGERDGVDVTEITCTPREDAVVVWGKIVVRVRTSDHMPLEITYFDEDGDLARTMTYSDIDVLGGRSLPRQLEVVPADEPDEATVVVYEELEYDVALDPDMFSLRSLRR